MTVLLVGVIDVLVPPASSGLLRPVGITPKLDAEAIPFPGDIGIPFPVGMEPPTSEEVGEASGKKKYINNNDDNVTQR